MATKDRRIPETATGQPTVKNPKRVPDTQTGQPSFLFGGQYPIMTYYVNQFSRLTGYVKPAAQAYSRAKRTLILSQDAIKRCFN